MLTDDPKDPRLTRGVDTAPVSQAPVYLVLSEAERAKGFVRPLRQSYRHVGDRPRFPLRDLTPEEKERWPDYAAYEDYPESERPCIGRGWTQAQLDKKGCGGTTTMALPLCETYARDPHFYGATYCCHCRMHLPVAEFVWTEDGKVVGS
jgi:hypothetical protein